MSLWNDLVSHASAIASANSLEEAMEAYNMPITGANDRWEKQLSERSPDHDHSNGMLEVREGAIEEQEGRKTFCRMLLVRDADGLILMMPRRAVTHSKQQSVVEIRKFRDKELFVKMYLSEGGSSHSSHGVLLESAYGFPVAFLNTTSTFEVGEEGIVSIMRPTLGEGLDQAVAPYAYAMKDTASRVILVRYHKVDGPIIHTVRVDYRHNSANVTDRNGGLLVTYEDSGERATIRMSKDMDAALALCVLIAAFKILIPPGAGDDH